MSDMESGVAKTGRLIHAEDRVPAVRREGATAVGATAAMRRHIRRQFGRSRAGDPTGC
jgi:hypothetical protein